MLIFYDTEINDSGKEKVKICPVSLFGRLWWCPLNLVWMSQICYLTEFLYTLHFDTRKKCLAFIIAGFLLRFYSRRFLSAYCRNYFYCQSWVDIYQSWISLQIGTKQIVDHYPVIPSSIWVGMYKMCQVPVQNETVSWYLNDDVGGKIILIEWCWMIRTMIEVHIQLSVVQWVFTSVPPHSELKADFMTHLY